MLANMFPSTLAVLKPFKTFSGSARKLRNAELYDKNRANELSFFVFVFVFVWLIIGFLWFVIGLKLLIKAWGGFQYYFRHFGDLPNSNQMLDL